MVKLYGFCLSIANIARRRHPYIESLPTHWYITTILKLRLVISRKSRRRYPQNAAGKAFIVNVAMSDPTPVRPEICTELYIERCVCVNMHSEDAVSANSGSSTTQTSTLLAKCRCWIRSCHLFLLIFNLFALTQHFLVKTFVLHLIPVIKSGRNTHQSTLYPWFGLRTSFGALIFQ